MKALLVAVNAKYVHSNLAVYSLRAYAGMQGIPVGIVEYTVNQRVDDIVEDIYGKGADWIGFSCYIWNIEMIKTIAETLRLIMPNIPIWFGGPEVSYHTNELLDELPFLDGVIMGEGELALTRLLQYYMKNLERQDAAGIEKGAFIEAPHIEAIEGVAYRDGDGNVRVNPPMGLLSMDDLPFPYEDKDNAIPSLQNRILYYESSRGCPFSCSYCLSSVDKTVRFRSLDKVYKELGYFLSKRVKQVKFVDRTFNLNPERTRGIWEFIRDNDNGVTNFHFEVSADLLKEEDFQLLQTMRKGLVQLEIGVQSTNLPTLQAIRRKTDWDRLKTAVSRIKEGKNVHQHLDLIVGLPYEGYEGVRNSFQDVYRMKPEQIKVGFLKVLKGAPIREEARGFGTVYRKYPPYEVLSTQWLPYSDLVRLKQVEEMVEAYYNSGQFNMTMRYLERWFGNPFDLYQTLGEYYSTHYANLENHSRVQRYEALFEFFKQMVKQDPDNQVAVGKQKMAVGQKDLEHQEIVEAFSQLLLFDFYARENAKKRPGFAGDEEKTYKREFYRNQEYLTTYLPHYQEFDSRQVARMTHLERFFVDIFYMAEEGEVLNQDVYVLFDYKKRDPFTNNARVVRIKR